MNRDYPVSVFLIAPILALILISGSISDPARLDQPSHASNAIEEYANDLLFLGYAESVAKSLSAESRSDEETARALVMWTHLNIRTQNTTPGLVINDGALNVVRRGYGYCDQSAQILASVAWALGWESRMWFLRDENGVSPHAVAEINWGDGWVLADPWLGLLGVDDDANLVSVADLSKGDAAYEASGYASAGFASEYFANADRIERLPYSLDSTSSWAALGWISELVYRGVGAANQVRDSAATALFASLGTTDTTLRILWPRDLVGAKSVTTDRQLLDGLDPNHAAYVAAVSQVSAGDTEGAMLEVERALSENSNSAWRASLVYLKFLLDDARSDASYISGQAGEQTPAEAKIRIDGASNLTVGLDPFTR